MVGSRFAPASRLAAALLLAGAAALAFAPGAWAQTLPEALPDLLQISKKMKSAEADVAAAREKAREALGDWFPKLDLTGSYGYQRQFKGNATADTSVPPRAFDMKITQLLWDFGSTNRTIDNARLSFDQATSARDAIEQNVILEGIVAYLDLMRRTRLLEFSRGSEDNIKRQTELEDARVQRGSGFSTDVLQSKRQLAGAQAARVRAEGALVVARNRYLSVFDKLPERPQAMALPRLPLDLLPGTLGDVVDIAGRENPQLKASKMSAEIARNNVARTFSDKFAPTINLVGEANHKNDFDGTLGTKNDRLVKVEGKYNFNLGFTAINTLRASEYTLTSTENKYGETLDTIQEQARNAWQELETTKQNLEHLRNEANIAAEFLELARKERALGRRSLIDVLAGETALINASSDATSAETDMSISVFKLLSTMGRLNLETVVPPSPPPAAPPASPRGEIENAPALAAVPEITPEKTDASPVIVAAAPSSLPASEIAAPPPPPPPPAAEAAAPRLAAAGESPRSLTMPPPAAWTNPDQAVPAIPAAPAVEEMPVLYAVRDIDLRAKAEAGAPALRVIRRCDAVQYLQGWAGWFQVRAASSDPGGAVEGWIDGQLVSELKSKCELNQAGLR